LICLFRFYKDVDECSGSRGEAIRSLLTYVDGDYIYIALDLTSPLQRHEIIQFLFDIDRDAEPDIPLAVMSTNPYEGDRRRTWLAVLATAPMQYSKTRALAEVRFNTDHSTFELRIPWRYFEEQEHLLIRALLIVIRGRIPHLASYETSEFMSCLQMQASHDEQALRSKLAA
jgi:hypothetical protein